MIISKKAFIVVRDNHYIKHSYSGWDWVLSIQHAKFYIYYKNALKRANKYDNTIVCSVIITINTEGVI
jgi:hypothetical protein